MNANRAAMSNTDRWYYNALLSNPQTGDTEQVNAVYSDNRRVPLLDDTEGWSVALDKISVTGSLANLPVLVPSVTVTNHTGDGLIYTNYALGIEYTLYNSSGVRIGRSQLLTEPVVIPSQYPRDPVNNAYSRYYWVETINDVVIAMNESISRLMAKSAAFAMEPSQSPLPNAVPFASTNTFYQGASQVSNSFFYFTQNKGENTISLHATGDVNPSEERRACTGPGLSGVFATIDLYFNDKLLELFPIDYLSPWNSLLSQWSNTPVNRPPTVDYEVASVTTGTGSETAGFYPLQLSRKNADYYVNMANTAYQTGFNFSTGTNSMPELIWKQETDTTQSWCPFTSLIIGSTTLPIYEQQYGINLAQGSQFRQPANLLSYNTLFEVDLTENEIHKIQDGISFSPINRQSVRLKGGRLSQIDLIVYLRTRTGELLQWSVTNGGLITVTLVFTYTS